MAVQTLTQLRTLQIRETIAARLVAALATAGQPTTNWAPIASGGIELSVVDMAAGALASIIAPKLQKIVEGRFLDLGQGAWLTKYAKSRYQLDRDPATYTIENVKLSSAPAAPPYQFPVGDLWVRSASGRRYTNIEAVDLPPSSSGVSVRFQAENPGADYNDQAGSIAQMVTAPAGVTCVNARPKEFAETTHLGSSSGTMTALFTNPAVRPTFDSVRIRIDTDGQVGAATYSLSTDGGATWPISGPLAGTIDVLGQAIVTVANGTAPSFLKGDIFTLLVGDAILQRGADAESDASLRERCRGRWTSLSDVPTEGLVRLWCHMASPEVARVRVDADPNTPGGMLVTIASAKGPASPAAQIAVQDFIQARLFGFRGVPASPVGGSPEERALVSSAHAREITPAGTVLVPRAKLAAVQEAADAAWTAYLGGVAIGGLVIQPELVQAVMDAGAVDFTAPHINGLSGNLQLLTNEVAVPAEGVTLTNTLVWKPV